MTQSRTKPIPHHTEGYYSTASHDYPFTAFFLKLNDSERRIGGDVEHCGGVLPVDKVEGVRPSLTEAPPKKHLAHRQM